MNTNKILATPFLRQCYVTLGVTTNVMTIGLVVGYSAVIVPQLRETKQIELDDESLSWIASIIGFSMIFGALIGPSIMSRQGRKTALITGCICNIIGWVLFIIASNMLMLIFARFFQGITVGILGVVAQVTIGEYTSPQYRGALLVLHPFSMCFGGLMQHVQGVYLTWKVVAVISLIINIVAILMVILSPETPSFLATKGRFDSCRKSFHWLRGHDEDDELEKMIKAAMLIKTDQGEEHFSVLKYGKDKIKYASETIKKKEFYKPVIIILHLQLLNLFSGSCLNETYAMEIFMDIFGNFNEMYYVLWSLDVQRIVTLALSMITIRKVKRKNVLLVTTLLNIIVFISIAGYVYGKLVGVFSNCTAVGVVLLHLHYFTMAAGCILLPNIIAGEICPLEYRGICGMISTLSYSTYLTVEFKTVALLFGKIGLQGAYLVYATVVGFSLIVLMMLLPETKDKTLLEIEWEFKGSQADNECSEKMIDLTKKVKLDSVSICSKQST
ncbi:hypothetical protein K1T71_006984 [Dendrolimus kikuchii]|uniref:Uncharacterized protein n=1 Tax=Dendrolimus kikuchii TaxID=765133 RepID=A0ACC1CZR1_9NEOP|nr:hypothetical protein K1T71_006984 [Dendrolimus kikuchii]